MVKAMTNRRASTIVLMTLVFFLLHSNHYPCTMVLAYKQNKMGRNIRADHGIKLLEGGGDRGDRGGDSSGGYGGGGHGGSGYGGRRRSIVGKGGGGRSIGGGHSSFIPYHPSHGIRGGTNTGQRARGEATKNCGGSLTITLTSIALCAALV